ncbi:unnamed protein product [Prorocentrum cordatum]|uniref:NmrA-like domain-containing protein n=1 Tax=Prorocentrum cordatum TaxID=2364126 RepID=A0ABN9WJZ2_9DINO|nr:unnamed protein product [Polarella glacialis]
MAGGFEASSSGRRGTGAVALAAACCVCCALLAPRSFAVTSRVERPLASAEAEALQGPRGGNLRAGGEAAPPPSAGAALAPGVVGLAALALALSASRRQAAAPLGAAALRGRVARRVSVMTESGTEQAVDLEAAPTDSSVVKKTSVLVLGATGTLGRQVVRQFLNAGYSVRCFIRNRADRPFSFLVDWGATVVEGSLLRKQSLPTSLIGIHTVIDCSTARPEESIYETDWEGKLAFVQCCEQMEVQRYVFMSIKDCDKYQNVPLMQIKYLMEKLLAKSKMRTTILRTSGYFQPLIAQYAVSILDDQPVWSDEKSENGIAYIDSQDCARMIAAAVSKERTVGKTITVTGPKVWSSQSLIELCEKLSGKKADVNDVSPLVVQATAAAASCFLWSLDIADRLRFVETQGAKSTDVMSAETYALLGVEKGSTRNLEEYIGEYYRRIMKMLEVGAYDGDEEDEEEDDEITKAAAREAAVVQEDVLPPGEIPEKEVSVVRQRQTADRLQKLFEDQILEDMADKKYDWFGITPVAEVVNGRSAMMGIVLGVFTEWATDVSVTKQIDELIAIFSTPS